MKKIKAGKFSLQIKDGAMVIKLDGPGKKFTQYLSKKETAKVLKLLQK